MPQVVARLAGQLSEANGYLLRVGHELARVTGVVQALLESRRGADAKVNSQLRDIGASVRSIGPTVDALGAKLHVDVETMVSDLLAATNHELNERYDDAARERRDVSDRLVDVADRLSELSRRVSGVSDRVSEVSTRLDAVSPQVTQLSAQIGDLSGLGASIARVELDVASLKRRTPTRSRGSQPVLDAESRALLVADVLDALAAQPQRPRTSRAARSPNAKRTEP